MGDLTPTQSVILDCLAARFRLGETLYTFDSRLGTVLNALGRLGLVSVMHGVVEHTIRASLTQAGRTLVLSPEYCSPLERRCLSLERRVEGLVDELRIALDRVPRG